MVRNVECDSNSDDIGNANLTGASLIQALDNLKLGGDKKKFISMQCQATASNTQVILPSLVLASSTSVTCGTATKASGNSKT